MYGKTFESMFTGSMYGSPPIVFAIWTYVISHMRVVSQDGEKFCQVELNPKLLAHTFSTPVSEVSKTIVDLEGPDPGSRTKTEEGRRLVRLTDWQDGPMQFRVVNGLAYREIHKEEERREYFREAKQRQRARVGMSNSANVQDMSKTVVDRSASASSSDLESGSGSLPDPYEPKDLTGSARDETIELQARADALVYCRVDAQWLDPPPHKWPETLRVFKTFKQATGHRNAKLGTYSSDAGTRAIIALFATGYTPQDLCEAIPIVVKSEWWRSGRKGLSALTAEVIRRGEAEALGPGGESESERKARHERWIAEERDRQYAENQRINAEREAREAKRAAAGATSSTAGELLADLIEMPVAGTERATGGVSGAARGVSSSSGPKRAQRGAQAGSRVSNGGGK